MIDLSTYIALCNESAQSLHHVLALCNYYNWYYLGGGGRNLYEFGDWKSLCQLKKRMSIKNLKRSGTRSESNVYNVHNLGLLFCKFIIVFFSYFSFKQILRSIDSDTPPER